MIQRLERGECPECGHRKFFFQKYVSVIESLTPDSNGLFEESREGQVEWNNCLYAGAENLECEGPEAKLKLTCQGCGHEFSSRAFFWESGRELDAFDMI